MGTRCGGTIVRILGNPARRNRGWMCANGNPARRNHCEHTRGNPARRNHCEDTREPGAAEPRLGVLNVIFKMLIWIMKSISETLMNMVTRSTMSRVGETHTM
ncbi:hypothetical protein RHMOL_Rhmol04G0204700 [Rhododendron molle]|uniref:Uncharacterized protein n=1 Tax=Rhododendron molle TaxID=49168 RepID=A0ACC0P2E8_RHOML|nr:hypothetical protein RHMOL_Rhmol04G0204700 [Rhododendron molle]